jgi:neurofibromin 1
VCPNEKFGAQIQKHVKELVGHEMSPALYPILFEQIKSIVEKFFDASGQVNRALKTVLFKSWTILIYQISK